MVNPRLLELETARQILGEIFHAQPPDVEDMIQRRLEGESLARKAGVKRKSFGCKNSAWGEQHGSKLLER